MRARAIVVMILVSACPFVVAQNLNRHPDLAAYGAIVVGAGRTNLSGLNDAVGTDIGGMDYGQPLIGGRMSIFKNRYVVGATLQGLPGASGGNDSSWISNRGGLALFDLGYAVINGKTTKLFPSIGIGRSRMKIASNDYSVDNVLGNEINIAIRGWTFDLSANIIFVPLVPPSKKSRLTNAPLVGLRVGYLMSLPSSAWINPGLGVTDIQGFGLQMFYVQFLAFGVGVRTPAR